MSDDFYPRSKPKKAKDGIKSKSQRGDFAQSWWAERWIEALTGFMDAGRLRRGKRYARQGQVLNIKEEKGGVTAQVQGSSSRPYRVSITLSPFSDKVWERVLDELSSEALFAAQLLSGEMPETIETAFTAAKVTLFPTKAKDLEVACSCPDPASVCKHAAATHYILGERFDEDPFLLFRLRGRTEEEIMAGLRARRGETETSEAAEPPPPPLSESLNRFWELPEELERLPVAPKAAAVPGVVLKRLGQPDFTKDDLSRLLLPAYRAAEAAALELWWNEGDDTDDDDARGDS